MNPGHTPDNNDQPPPPYRIPRPGQPAAENGSNTNSSHLNKRPVGILLNKNPLAPPPPQPPAYNNINSGAVFHVSGDHSLDRRTNVNNNNNYPTASAFASTAAALPKPPSPTGHFGNPLETPRALKKRNGASQEDDDRY